MPDEGEIDRSKREAVVALDRRPITDVYDAVSKRRTVREFQENAISPKMIIRIILLP